VKRSPGWFGWAGFLSSFVEFIMSKSDTKAAVIYAMALASIGSVVVGTKAQIKGLAEAGSVDPHPDAVEAALAAGGKTIDLNQEPDAKQEPEGSGKSDPAS